MSHALPSLPYPHEALEPFIDARTMEIHHGKHHAAYVKNLNDALQKIPDFAETPLEDLIKSLEEIPETFRIAIRNNGGGHYNHSLFWKLLSPPKSNNRPIDRLLQAIEKNFGGLQTFKEEFTKIALGRFGSGWIWLTLEKTGFLKIASTPNQDNPIMENEEVKVIAGLDLWEHAYYLKHQNRRADYIDAWWNVVNWNEAEKRLTA